MSLYDINMKKCILYTYLLVSLDCLSKKVVFFYSREQMQFTFNRVKVNCIYLLLTMSSVA